MAEITSRERVLTTFMHKTPDQVPMWCGASREFWNKAKLALGLDDEALRIRFHDDFRRVSSVYNGDALPDNTTVFGVKRHGIGYGHAVNHPLCQANMRDIESYIWPDPKWIDVSKIKFEARAYKKKYAILGGEWPPFWHDAIDLLGMEQLYILMYEQPEIVDCILKHIVDYYFEVNRCIFDAAADEIDICFIGNDFGSQTGPLLGRSLFDRFIIPHLKIIIDLAHDYKLKAMLHCCGGIEPLIPPLIEIHLDAIHAVEPSCSGMDLTELKRKYGDKIVFNGGIDSHHVLIDGDKEYVRKTTVKVLDILAPNGGYIAGASHDSILEETPVENVLAMFDTIRDYCM